MTIRAIPAAIAVRYLRAVGADPGETSRIEGLLLELPVTDMLQEITEASPDIVDDNDALMALTLCHAAEQLLARSRVLRAGRSIDVVRRLDAIGELEAVAMGLLEEAGVEFAAWAATRDGSGS